eukprot:TRINITY_DN5386_c0_g1_i3.p1 TRINITY_DN5386_c0_g1~~TRINITY_DN5386_c0_g1_i3.p1  ORF type:complete len:121 (-),score=26.63 TRINITY_DN5386_c0_g1_i3:129-491(-)
MALSRKSTKRGTAGVLLAGLLLLLSGSAAFLGPPGAARQQPAGAVQGSVAAAGAALMWPYAALAEIDMETPYEPVEEDPPNLGLIFVGGTALFSAVAFLLPLALGSMSSANRDLDRNKPY